MAVTTASSHTSVEENLKCSICSDIFRDPVVLGCTHSFCKACLDRTWKRMEVKKCPLCGKTSKSTPLHSLSLKNTCESVVAEKRRRISVEPKGMVCLLHAEKQQLFCVDDQKMVCMQCVAHDHKDHNFCSISKAAGEHKTRLQKTMKELQDSLQTLTSKKTSYSRTAVDELQSQIQLTEKQIKEEFEKLYQFLRKEEKARIAALKEEEKKKRQRIDEKIKELEGVCADLSERIKKMAEDMAADDSVFLHNFRDIEDRAKYTVPNLNLTPGPTIDVAKHLGNLKYKVWEKMKDLCPYYPVILEPATKKLNLKVSEDLSSVIFQGVTLSNSPEKSITYVLGSEGFISGTYTWEVEVGNSQQWAVGVMKKSDKSPKLFKGSRSSNTPSFTKVRVTVDCEKGHVMLTDPNTNTTLQSHPHVFNEKVYPCFWTNSQLRILPAKVTVCVDGNLRLLLKHI